MIARSIEEIALLSNGWISRRRGSGTDTPASWLSGTCVPYFSTDTWAAQRALEIHAEALLKGTKVDGVYTADPQLDPSAERLDLLAYGDFLREGYGVMDATAVSLSMENKLPIIVFDLREEGNIRRVVTGEPIGTLVH